MTQKDGLIHIAKKNRAPSKYKPCECHSYIITFIPLVFVLTIKSNTLRQYFEVFYIILMNKWTA